MASHASNVTDAEAKKRGSAKEMVTSLDTKLTKMQDAMGNLMDDLEDVKLELISLKDPDEGLEARMQGALNITVGTMQEQFGVLEAWVEALSRENQELRAGLG